MGQLDQSKVEYIVAERVTKSDIMADTMGIAVRHVQMLWAKFKDTPECKIVFPATMGRPRRGTPTRREWSAVPSARRTLRSGANRIWDQIGKFGMAVLNFSNFTLEDTLQKLFYDAGDETFEDGMASFFSASLIRIVRDHGVVAVRALERILSAADVNIEVAEESLRQMGRMDDEKTHRYRLSLLERALESPNARIRDAASVGIEAMDDPAAIESLQRAIDSELYEQLRQNFKDVLAQLRGAG